MRLTPHVIAVAVLAVATLLSGCAGLATNTNSSSPTTAEVGDSVRDGQLAFTVVGVDAPLPIIGDRTARGEFVLVHLTVRNVGNAPRTFDCDAQKLKDAAGKSYSSSDDAEIALSESEHDYSANALSTQINPGNYADVAVVFDLPVGTTPVAMEVHDSVGVTVKLPQSSKMFG